LKKIYIKLWWYFDNSISDFLGGFKSITGVGSALDADIVEVMQVISLADNYHLWIE